LSGEEYRKKLEVLNLLSNKRSKGLLLWTSFLLFCKEFGKKLRETAKDKKAPKSYVPKSYVRLVGITWSIIISKERCP
jgi:hypothetical protein